MQNEATLTAAQIQYAAHERAIDELLAKLQAHRASHAQRFAAQPRNWGFAGDIGAAETRLAEAVEMLNPAWQGS